MNNHPLSPSLAASPACSADRSSESGAVLIVAMFMAIVTVGLSLATMTYLASYRQQSNTAFVLKGQSVQFARAGLIESLNWFRRQPSQPVRTFAPRLDPIADPAVIDTDDPEVGLVREFRVQGDFWGRYEVYREWDGDLDAERAQRRTFMQATDVTEARMGATPGSVWRLRSTGYVFKRLDANVPFDQAPNQIRAVTVLESEIGRLAINLPAPAALNVSDGNHATVNTLGMVEGGSEGVGIAYPAGSGTPSTGSSKIERVTGSPALAPTPDYDESLKAMVGYSFDEVAAFSDYVVHDDDDFPSPVPPVSLVVAEMPSLRFTPDRPLAGSGLIAIRGNVTMDPNGVHDFDGILHVDGNFSIRGPCEIRGSVICTGSVTVQGTQGEARIIYDADAVASIQAALENYRRSGPVHMVFEDL